MRLGGQIVTATKDPESWAEALKLAGFRAAVFPVDHEADEELISSYVEAAMRRDILIAEVGAWSNPLSSDGAVRKAALERCRQQLDLAERIGARCCVNIAGSRGRQWDGPHPDNFSADTFEMIVETTREIIDAVKPKRTFFALETMPWIFPDTADSYLELVKAIDRPGFAVHLDPVNMISSPRVYFRNGDMIKDFFTKLGPYIKNGHAKDIRLAGKLTVQLEEVIPGEGELNYPVYLTELSKLHPDTPLIIEHLSTQEQYSQAAAYIRQTAAGLGIDL